MKAIVQQVASIDK
jgi:ABC-type transporter Mla subunit MlaD